MKYEYNVTDNVLDVRELDDEEIRSDQAHQLFVADKMQAEEAEAEAKAIARAAILDRLGITADEAKLLLS